jgi:hypothetical protein
VLDELAAWIDRVAHQDAAARLGSGPRLLLIFLSLLSPGFAGTHGLNNSPPVTLLSQDSKSVLSKSVQ